MTRPLRLEFAGAIYHVTSRGNAQAAVFLDDADRVLFLDSLREAVARFGLLCHAYCLMDNHYHLLLETPRANLSVAMRQINGVYTQRFNKRNTRVGHVFQGRFKAIVVDRQSYLLELSRYVVQNPVRAGMVASAADYTWSSYRASVGLVPTPEWLCTDWLLSQFGADRQQAVRAYAEFVAAGQGATAPWSKVRGQAVLGSEAFVQGLAPLLAPKNPHKEISRLQRLAARPSLAALFDPMQSDSDKTARNALICAAHVEHGYSMAAIARHLGLHYSTVSQIVKAVETTQQAVATGKASAVLSWNQDVKELVALLETVN